MVADNPNVAIPPPLKIRRFKFKANGVCGSLKFKCDGELSSRGEESAMDKAMACIRRSIGANAIATRLTVKEVGL